MPRLRACPGFVPLLAVVLGACSSQADSPAGEGETGPEAWQLETPPAASIGVVEGDEHYQFVYVSAALMQEDGRIFVVDGGKSALTIFDSAGTFLASVGSRGRGPGEFQRPSRAWLYRGDSVAVSDLVLRRVSIFDAQGRFVRSFTNPVTWARKPGVIPSQSCCQITGSFADGSFIGHPPDDIPNQPGPPRHSRLTLMRVAPDGTSQDTIGTFDSALYGHDASRPNGIRGYETSYYFRYAASGNMLVGGNGLTEKLVRMSIGESSDGSAVVTRLDSIPLPRPPQAFTAELQAEYEDALRADYERRPRGSYYEGSLESNWPQQYPPVTPGFVNIFADAEGRIWLQRWTPLYNRLGAPLEYDVITPDGRHVASITLPVDARPLWAGRGRVLVVERDSLDVQYVRLYRARSAPR